MSATNTIKGVVDSVRTKTRNTRYGDKHIHLVTVDGIEFETGFKSVFSQGEMITAAVEHKYGGWQYVEGGDVTLPGVATAAPAAVSISAAGGKPSGGFPINPTSHQISIIRQNSMNRAVEILDCWIKNSVVTLTSEAAYLKKLIEVALIVTDFNSGQDIMQLKAAQAANLEAATTEVGIA